MKKVLTSLFLVSLFFTTELKASHIAGGDLSYVCLGNNQYQINLNLFVDCLGFDPGNVQTINFNSPCGTTSISVNALNPGGTEISQLCPSQLNNSTCNGGTLPGMWVFHYTGTVTLAPCNSWTMSWEVCCRNNAVLNITNASSFGSYIEASLNNASFSCDNSPSFTAQPIPYVCQGQVVNYSYGVTEADGDSLYYSLINAMDAGGTLLTYAAGYSATSPIPGITINPFTGMLTFTPSTLGNFVVVVLVEEYDSNGNLIGTVMRDIQFIVQSCSNSVPDPVAGQITGMTGSAVQTGPYSIELCEGSDFTFTATYTDQNAADVLTLISNIATVLPGSTFTSSGTNPITATISWTAPAGSANTNTTFSVTVDDGSCPVPGQQTFVYDIQVQPRTLAGPDIIICGPQSATLSGTGGSVFNWAVISGPPMVVGTNFSCNPCANPVATPSSTTVYEVTSDLSGTCVNKDTVTVTVVPDYTFSTTQSDTVTCLASTIDLNTIVNPAGNYSYLWSPGTFLSSTTIPNPVVTLTTPGTYNYFLTVTSPLGCVHQDTVQVTATAAYAPIATLSYTSDACLGDSIHLNASFGPAIPANCGVNPVGCSAALTGTVGTGSSPNTTTSYPAPYGNWYTTVKQQFLYTAAELNAAGITGGKIDQIDFNITALSGISQYHFYSVSMGCTNLNTFSFSPSAFETGLFNVFPPSTYNITTGWNAHPFTGAFEWDGLSNIIVEVCFNELNPGSNYTTNSTTGADNTTYVSTLYSLSDVTDQCSNGAPFIQTANSHPQIRFHYCGGAPDTSNFSYIWSPTSLVASPTASNTEAAIIADTTFTLVVTDNISGCVDTSSISVIALPPTTFTLTVGNDVTICPGAPTTLSASGATNYAWSPSTGLNDSTLANPTASPMTTTTYTVLATTPCAPSHIDSITVSAVNSVIITVNAGPDVTTCPGTPVTLNASGATSYTWSPPATLSNSTIANPVATISTPSTITYTVTGTAFCADPVVDSVTVTAANSVILNVSAGADLTTCPGAPITLNATGATSYTWSPPTALSSSTIANPVATLPVVGSVTYTVTGSANCANPVSDVITVTAVNSVILNVDAGNDTIVCPGFPTQLTATGATQYVWTPSSTLSNPNIASPFASPSTTTTYTVVGTAFCANPVTDSVTVSTVSSTGPLTSNAGVDQQICTGEPMDLIGASTGGYGNNTYLWTVVAGEENDSAVSPTSMNTSIITTLPGTNMYEFQVRDQCGVISADTVIIDITADCMVIVPNIFTPNGDGDNDEFIISSNGVRSFSIAIYNRWGKKLFESNDIKNGWNGGNSPDGTYFYIMKAETNNGKAFDKQGYFQLLGK
jgi:gliding motility-associated-like protein